MSNQPDRQDREGSRLARNVRSTWLRVRRRVAVVVRWGRRIWQLIVFGYALYRWYNDGSPG